MTPKELYDWAVDNDWEACDISVCILEDGVEYILDFDITESTINKKSDYESVEFYTDNGELIPDKITQKDLMMRDDDYEYKLARGEYGPTVKENLTVDTPTCKESLPVDREYWRRVYAGQAMMGIFAGRNWRKDGAPDCIEHARNAVELADALIAELDKTNNNEK